MIRVEQTSAELTRDRVQAWLRAEQDRRMQIAAAAAVHEKTLRLAVLDGWDPRVSTLQKLEAVMPKGKKRRVA